MVWLLVLLLVALMFVGLRFVAKLDGPAMQMVAVALCVAVAGYAWQGHPSMAGKPGKAVIETEQVKVGGETFRVLRRQILGQFDRADSWLTMASRHAEHVLSSAKALADAEGHIEECDRREIAFCPIDDVEFALQHGTGDSFLDACREVSSGERKGFMLSVAHMATRQDERPYPFRSRVEALLPWMASGTGSTFDPRSSS